jgi:hypothetical protein
MHIAKPCRLASRLSIPHVNAVVTNAPYASPAFFHGDGDMGHRLQAVFATVEGEAAYVDTLRMLIEDGQFHAAETLLLADLQALDTGLAQMCLATSRDQVTLSGWTELVESIAVHEGEPITGVAIGMGNDADLVFERDELHAPFVMLGIYADGAFCFSGASREGILAQCKSDAPEWSDSEEDIEVYLELGGLAPINTALIRHKHQFFLRDDNPAEAPVLYVECVLAGWFRALRFHQAIAAELATHGLPGDIPVVSGIAGMRPDVATVHYPEKTVTVASGEVATLVLKPKAKRDDVVIDFTGTGIRRRIEKAHEPEVAKSGFFKRLFGRG